MKKLGKTYRIALYGIMFATIFVAMMIDRLYSLALASIELPSMAIIVLLVTFTFAMTLNDWLTGFFAGVFFGLASVIKAFMFGELGWLTAVTGSESPLTILYSLVIYLVPRLFVGISAFAVYRLLVRLLRKMQNIKNRERIAMTAGTLIGLIVNTVLFLTILNLCKRNVGMAPNTLFNIVKAALITNILPEYVVSLILAPQIALTVRTALKLGIEAKARIGEDAELDKGTQCK